MRGIGDWAQEAEGQRGSTSLREAAPTATLSDLGAEGKELVQELSSAPLLPISPVLKI